MMVNDTLEELARCFRALGDANRLELLSMLSGPRTLDEIGLGLGNPQPGENPDRTLTGGSNGGGNGAVHGNGQGSDTWHRPGVPYLAVVHGPSRGRFIALHDRAKTEHRGWLIGRCEQACIRMAIDPMVDDQHAEIIRTADGFKVLDLRTSGPTTVNWEPIPLGESRALSCGDVIGVGNSLLVFGHPTPGLARSESASQLVTEVEPPSGRT